jgi:CRP/FNR family transcriptional regulator, cyclic AMP receptor protein
MDGHGSTSFTAGVGEALRDAKQPPANPDVHDRSAGRDGPETTETMAKRLFKNALNFRECCRKSHNVVYFFMLDCLSGTAAAMNEATAKQLVGRAGWLASQPDWVRDAILSASRLQMYEAGRFIFYAGDDPGGMYGMVDGGIGVKVPSGANDMLLCHILRRGYWFGYGPALNGGERKVTFKAVEKSHVLHCPLRAILAIGAEKPEFFRALGALNDHNLMMSSVQLVGDLLIPSGDKRIAAVLARIAKPNPGDEEQGSWPIRISQAEIGQMCNASRDRVNRALGKFEAAGWLEVEFKMIVIRDLAAMERFAAAPSGALS